MRNRLVQRAKRVAKTNDPGLYRLFDSMRISLSPVKLPAQIRIFWQTA
jgi:hypothetical protein